MKRVKREIIKGIDRATSSEKIGSIFFGVGLLIAAIMAIVVSVTKVTGGISQAVNVTLIILGLIIGYVNITSQEANSFMIASVILVLLTGPFFGNLIQSFPLGEMGTRFLGELFKNIIWLLVPAAMLVSLRTLFYTARNEE